jgi:4-amino-4-deoxy-L-arabinose transferase-like glycosyltransferase
MIEKQSERRKLFFLIGIAFALRLYLVITAKGIDPDGIVYLSAAKDLLDKNYYKAFSNVFPPFYPFLTALLYPVTRDFELAGRIISLIFGTLIVFPIFYLGKRLFGETVAIFSVLLSVFQPYLAQFSGSVLTESIYTFLIALGVLVGWKGLDSRSKGFMFLVGILLGLAYLTRPEGIGFVVLLSLWIFFFGGMRFWQDVGIKFSMFFSLMAGTVIFALPYILFLHEVTGRWILSRKIGL